MSTKNQFQIDKKKTLLQFGIVIAIAILLNVISTKWHAKFDLTDDHRFTLSAPTKKMLAELKDDVNVKVLMAGKLPSNYTKLLQGTSDVLKAFEEASNGKVKFSFENPFEGKTGDEKLKAGEALMKQGISPMPLTSQADEGTAIEKRYVVPYAQLFSNEKVGNICLLENHFGMDMDGILNYSESMMEYKLANTIKQLNKSTRESIAYVMGNGEVLGESTRDALTTLAEYYDLDTIDLNNDIQIPTAYRAIIICRPTEAFDEKLKFKIDQYVMNGGRILWYVDAINCSLDTMQSAPTYTAIPFELNLDDMLLKYGVRLNTNLIEDLQCNEIPLTVGMIGNTPDIRNEPWIYFPVHTPTSKHPIVNNMDAVYSRFVGSMDTITNKDNRKTVLLSSSQYSRTLAAPLTVSFNIVRYKPKTTLYNKKYLPVAVALEGGFSSLYENRMDAGFTKIYEDSLGKKFMPHTVADNKMIVVSDADMMLNDFSKKRGIAELGMYTATGKLFANKTFLLNCMEYLTENNSLLEARGKDVQLRLLDKKMVKENKVAIQFLNIALPILIVIFTGALYFFMRRKKYENKLA
jgi:ABC-2 type transport system permease protein